MSDSYRLRLTYDAPTAPTALPPTLIAKVPAVDPASRSAARTFRTYEIEASFYGQLSHDLPVALATCYFAGYDPEAEGGRIFSYDVTGGLYEEHRFFSVGSGSLFARVPRLAVGSSYTWADIVHYGFDSEFVDFRHAVRPGGAAVQIQIRGGSNRDGE